MTLKINRMPAKEHPAYQRTTITPIAKRPKRRPAAPPASKSE